MQLTEQASGVPAHGEDSYSLTAPKLGLLELSLLQKLTRHMANAQKTMTFGIDLQFVSLR